MFFVRQNATHKLVVGPAVSVSDGFTPVTTLTLSGADEAEVILHDNGTVVSISGYTWAAITTADGYYHLTLQSGITGTVGHVTVVVNDDSLILPLKAEYTVVEEAVYDAFYAASATGNTAAVTTIASDLVIVASDLLQVYSDTTIIASDLVQVYSDTTIVVSDTTAINTQTTTIASDLVIVASDLLQVYSDTTIVVSDTTAINTQTTTIASDLVIVASDLLQVYSDTTIVVSDTTAINTQTTTIASDLVQVYSDTTAIPTVAAIADGVWDEVITGAQHNVASSAAKFLREGSQSTALTGTAQSATSTTIVLASGAVTADDIFNFDRVEIIDGTGAGQSRLILDSVSSTDTLTVNRAWTVNPDATSVYAIMGAEADVRTIGGQEVSASATVNFDNLNDWANGGRLDLILDTVASDLVQVYSDTTIIVSDTTAINTQTTTIASDVVQIYSDTTIVVSDTTAINTQTTTIASDLVQVYSDTTTIASDLVQVYSDTTAIHSDTTIVASDVVLVEAVTTALTSAAATKLAASATTIITGTVDTGSFTATTTEFEADDITEATADHYNGRIVIFTSGALLGQATDITDYALSGANGHFTVTALTEAPANNATFVIV